MLQDFFFVVVVACLTVYPLKNYKLLQEMSATYVSFLQMLPCRAINLDSSWPVTWISCNAVPLRPLQVRVRHYCNRSNCVHRKLWASHWLIIESPHWQSDSILTHSWVILSVRWLTLAQMSHMTHSEFSVCASRSCRVPSLYPQW